MQHNINLHFLLKLHKIQLKKVKSSQTSMNTNEIHEGTCIKILLKTEKTLTEVKLKE